jgi:hypothetical protein
MVPRKHLHQYFQIQKQTNNFRICIICLLLRGDAREVSPSFLSYESQKYIK